MTAKGIALVHADTKEARTASHRLLSLHVKCLRSQTEARGGKQTVVCYFSHKASKKRKRDNDFFVRFVLQKVWTHTKAPP